MHGRHILITALLAMTTFAAPTPAANIAQRENTVVQRNDALSLAGIVQDVEKRNPLVEPIPDAALEAAIEQRDSEVDNNDEDDSEVDIPDTEDTEERGITLASDNDKRGLTRPGKGGSNKRGLHRGKGGSNKRGLSRGGNGGGNKRGLSRGGNGGGNKRGLSRGGNGGGNKRGLSRGGNGGGNKRGLSRGGNGGGN